MTPLCTKTCLRIETRSSCELLGRFISVKAQGLGGTVLAHDIYVLLNGIHNVRVWNGIDTGDEAFQFVLSGLEVIQRVLEASDFLNDQCIGSSISEVSWVP